MRLYRSFSILAKKDAIGIYTPERPYTMYVGSNGEKKIWLQHLNQTIRRHLHGKEASDDVEIGMYSKSYWLAHGGIMTYRQSLVK